MRKNELRSKITSGVCLSMLLPLMGCGTNGNVSTDNIDDTVVPTDVVSENVSVPKDVSEENATAKEHITDFDAQVNNAWKEEVRAYAEEKGYHAYNAAFQKDNEIEKRVLDILENTDLATLDPESDLYKTIYIYRQLEDCSWRENDAGAAIKAELDRFDKVRNIDELYALYKDPYYGEFNSGMRHNVIKEDVFNINYVYPYNLNGQETISEEQGEVLKEYLVHLGFTEERASEIVSNATEMDAIITDYLYVKDSINGYHYYDLEDCEEYMTSYPIVDILTQLGAVGKAQYIKTPYLYHEFVNTYYTGENVMKIRDYSIADYALALSKYADDETQKKIAETFSDYSYSGEYDRIAYWIVCRAGDVLAKEYNARYICDADIENTEQFTEDIIKSMCDILKNTEWLSVHGMEQARKKTLHFEICIGENAVTNDLSEVTLSEDPMMNKIALYTDHINFTEGQLFCSYEDRNLFNKNVLMTNAFYYPAVNAIIICDGCLEEEYSGEAASYEEKLGRCGFVIAHELSHAYDPNGIDMDYEGYYEPWLTEEEAEIYREKVEQITTFFDGMEIDGGNVINGETVTNEAFADLLAMKICLNILGQMDDPDYDAFFKAYAAGFACYYTEEGLEEVVNDSHLPYMIRVNCIPAQFDEFYETYDVDPDSPYYVPEEKRLDIF